MHTRHLERQIVRFLYNPRILFVVEVYIYRKCIIICKTSLKTGEL